MMKILCFLLGAASASLVCFVLFCGDRITTRDSALLKEVFFRQIDEFNAKMMSPVSSISEKHANRSITHFMREFGEMEGFLVKTQYKLNFRSDALSHDDFLAKIADSLGSEYALLMDIVFSAGKTSLVAWIRPEDFGEWHNSIEKLGFDIVITDR